MKNKLIKQIHINSRMISRRTFNSSIGTLGAYGLIGFPIISKFNLSPKSNLIPYVDPMTAMSIANLTLSLIQNFTSGSGNVLTSLMEYQIGLLNQISIQLDQIQRSLLNLSLEIESLPSKIKEEFIIQFKNQTIVELQAVISRYKNNILDPSIVDINIYKNPQILNEIQNILYIVDQKISIIKNLPDALGPETCLIVPLAMSLEIACRTKLNMPKAQIISILESKYKQWFIDMLGDNEGSIPSIEQRMILAHDEYIDSNSTTKYANQLGVSNYKLNGNQTSDIIEDPRVLILRIPPSVGLTGLDKNNGTTKALSIEILSGIYLRLTSLKSTTVKDINVNIINFDELIYIASSDSDELNSIRPREDGKYSYCYKAGYNDKTRGQVESIYNIPGKPWHVNDSEREELKSMAVKVNSCRTKMSLCITATTIANNSIHIIDDFLKYLL